MAAGLEAYDLAYVPQGYGLNNTGLICHINALLQAIASNSVVVRATLANRNYLERTTTGQAFFDYIWTAVPAGRPYDSAPFGGEAPIDAQSAKVLSALTDDLRARRPDFQYGPSQESASEGLVLLLDMMDDPEPSPLIDSRTGDPCVAKNGEEEEILYEENPISRLFYHRYEAVIYCKKCKGSGSAELEDVAVQFNLFHYDAQKNKPSLPAEFGELIRSHVSHLEDYKCEKCGEVAGAYRHYRLRMIPEVLVCLFNLYNGRTRATRYFPERIPFPGADGGQLIYRLTAQVEQFGNRAGGHYIARGRRADGVVYQFDDTSFSRSALGTTPNVYMMFYHYESEKSETRSAPAEA